LGRLRAFDNPEVVAPRAVPKRVDLPSRSTRTAAPILLGVLHLYDRLKDRVLVEVTPPGDDRFYDQPGDLDSYAPGAVIDSRPVDIRLFRRRLRVDAWHVKFRTSTSDGTPAAGVATVMVDRGRRNGSRRSLLAYQPAIDSLGAAGDPSYTLRRGDHLELPVMRVALRRGWVVVAVDWTGPQRSFVDLALAARFVLDGIRAALNFGPAGLGAGTPVGLWGYSGGALATLFAAEQHPGHAPELNIVGAAAGGAGVDMTSSPEMFEVGNLLSGIPFGACIAASRAFPDFDLTRHLTPHGRAMVAAAEEMTMEQLAMSFPFVRMSSILTVPTVSEVPGARACFEATRCGQGTPRTAMYLYHAVHDQAPAIADVDALVERYRGDGVDVAYRRYRFGEHLIVMFRAVPSALRFLAGRVRDAPTPLTRAS
jgi:pimeloyl-ACP methyl ester carboxylesterase